MHATRIAGIVLRQFYLLRGSVARLVPLFAWVAVDVLLWGFITRYLSRVAPTGFNFVSVLLGAVLLWDFYGRVMQGVTTAFLEDVWSRNFLNFFASPLSITEYLAGLILTSVATSFVGLVVMLVLAGAVFGLSFLAYGSMVVLFLLILFLFGIALGIAAAAVVLRLGPASEWFVWPIPALLSPFAAVFYPVSSLPGWMQYLAWILPPSYVFETMRAVVAGHEVSGNTFVPAICLAVLDIILACWLFVRVHRYAVRTGLIARYSAESVS